MKKIISIICAAAMLASMSIHSFAKPGDISGRYYATDIKTYLNGAEIEAINIGGQTLISAENMQYHNFSVFWNSADRILDIYEIKNPGNITPPPVTSTGIKTGTPLGYYYETDIVTFLDGLPIKAYNTNGRTYIHAEEMANFGYVVNWYAGERKLEIISPVNAGYVYDMELSYAKQKETDDEAKGAFSVKYTKDGLAGTDDADYLDMTMHSTGREYNFDVKFYQNKALYNSAPLINKLKSLCYDGYGVAEPCDKSEKYDLVSSMVTVSINGQKSERISVMAGAGNGHRDFYFTVEGLTALKRDDINEIIFSFGEATGEPYEIKFAE